MARDIRITRIISRTENVAVQLRTLQSSGFTPRAERWEPAVNAFSYQDRFEVCFELAGVDRNRMEVRVEGGKKLIVRGVRSATEPPPCSDSPCRQILALEIEGGPFERVLQFPRPVDASRVKARFERGLMWVTLPVVAG